MLWVRALDSPNARMLPGTQDADLPFWSPDNRSVGFFAQGKLKTIELSGGSPQMLASAANRRGATWGPNGLIVFSPVGGSSLFSVNAAGGPVAPFTRLNTARQELGHSYPYFLPDGRHYLYQMISSDDRVAGLYTGTIGTSEIKRIASTRSRAEYSNGFLIFGRDGNVVAQPFDLERLVVSGEPVRVGENLGISFGELGNYAFSVSSAGTLTYWGGSYMPRTQVTIVDANGRVVARPGEPGEHYGVAVSPDQTRVALEQRDPKANSVDVWVMELATGIRSRFTSSPSYDWTGSPVWAADGAGILFTAFKNEFEVKGLRGADVDRIPLEPGFARGGWPMVWSPDGQYVVIVQNDPDSGWDLWTLPTRGDRKPVPYLKTPYEERQPDISPDSHWIAYSSDESGRREIYIDSFPRAGNKVRVSTNGGLRPRWTRDGRDLYYLTNDGVLFAARIAFSQSVPLVTDTRRLFQAPRIDLLLSRSQFAVLGNGERFLFNAFVDDPKPQGLTVVTNWRAAIAR